MVWSTKQTENLISLLECNPCLWDQRNPDYSRNVVKEAALTEISQLLFETKDAVRAKIKSLRSQISGGCAILYFKF